MTAVALAAQLTVSAGTLTSMELAGRRNVHAWPLVAATHGLFVIYLMLTRQYGLIVWSAGAIFYGIRNWRRWLHEPQSGG